MLRAVFKSRWARARYIKRTKGSYSKLREVVPDMANLCVGSRPTRGIGKRRSGEDGTFSKLIPQCLHKR